MSSEPRIRLTGHIDVPADRLTVVRAALPIHIALTRAEAGCVSFDVTEDTEVAGRFLVAELFMSQAAFNAHKTRTKASAWATISAGVPRSYEIQEVSE
ncbi:MAG: putative quinol monooxygenase [Shimia sp.]|uniref:putative quinol monooxygenase n=1 Tax=Shimia sp. TaxID=1954381 RepID=UPI004059ADBA